MTYSIRTLGALAALLWASAAIAAPIEIPVILPNTGGAAFLGQSERQALEIAAGVINARGGIKGDPLHFTFYDDQSSPQVAVQLANQVKTQNPAIVLGSAIVAMCNAMVPVLAGGPLQYCFSPGIHPAAGSPVFTAGVSTHDLAEALVRYYRGRGFTRLAMITSTDASGQDGRLSFEDAMKLPENAGLTMAASVQFNPSDVSVSAQIQKIKGADPQAVIVWTSGAPFGTVLKGIVQSGLDVPVGTTDANMTHAQMQQYAAFLPTEMLYMCSQWPRSPDTVLDAGVVKAQDAMFAAYKAAGALPDNGMSHAWDTAFLVADALTAVGRDATPEQLRARLAGLTGWAGVNGVYDFTKVPQRGVGLENSVATRWDPAAKTWVIVSRPGGSVH